MLLCCQQVTVFAQTSLSSEEHHTRVLLRSTAVELQNDNGEILRNSKASDSAYALLAACGCANTWARHSLRSMYGKV